MSKTYRNIYSFGNMNFIYLNAEERDQFKIAGYPILMIQEDGEPYYYGELGTYLSNRLNIPFSEVQFCDFTDKKYILAFCKKNTLNKEQLQSLCDYNCEIEASQGFNEEDGETFDLTIKFYV